MTLKELLPAIEQLSDAEKHSLWELLDHDLHSEAHTPPILPIENFENEGQWLIAVLNQCFGEMELSGIPIAPREPMRIDESLFGDT
ncbi:MAG: hypothetical protein HC795_09710 [Coleofasciculaceae cyanobacterium RL_1_1]|nr:hypothetical protein [Coleofasciculaceae cyanobacterium RL_1_1]